VSVDPRESVGFHAVNLEELCCNLQLCSIFKYHHRPLSEPEHV
jgi:hypothetical protein